jgi:2-methylcitrate dehydratase PrpD
MVTVVPAALAAAQLAGAPGRRLVEAIVFGYEVASRLGGTTARGIIHSRGFHPTSTIGTVAAAGAAAAALDLPPDQTAHALAVAAGRCAGLFHFAPESWTKPLQAGWAAGAGVDSALLASHGFAGPLSILEGRHGLLQALAGDGAYDPSGLFTPAGSWAIHEVSYKPYAHSTELHVAVDALIEALADLGHDAVSIDRIEVTLRPAACRATTEPAAVKHRPATSRDAQQSAYFAIAVAAHAGRTRIPFDSFYQWFEPDRLHCPEVLNLAARVVVLPDPALDVAAGDASPARVSVMARSGRRADRTLTHHRGSPARPFAWEDLEARFAHLTGRLHQLGPVRTVLGSESVEPVAALLEETRPNEEGTRGGR